jgi:hypothetical protein
MAKKKTSAKSSFYEVVFRGKPKVVRAFLSGLLMGAGRDATIYYSFLEGIHHEGKVERLAEMVGLRGTDCHVVVDAETSTYLKSMTRRITQETGLEVTSHRHVRSASMDFTYTAYARRYDEEIQAVLKKLPDGVKVVGFQHEERIDPGARGVEAYSPAHHYEATGRGTLTGRVDVIVELKRKVAEYPLIQAEDVVLKLA